jgi:PhnB protein
MSHSYKPDSYTSVAPYLVVNGAAQTIDFLVKVFGAERLRSYPGEGDKVSHAEVRIDDTVIMISDSVEGWSAVPSHVHVYVRDVDATYLIALEAGAISVQDPMRKDDEDKRGGIRDPGGTT